MNDLNAFVIPKHVFCTDYVSSDYYVYVVYSRGKYNNNYVRCATYTSTSSLSLPAYFRTT